MVSPETTTTTAHPGKTTERPWALISLPPFPGVAMRVLQLLSKDDVGFKELTALICSDMALSSEILTLANSAFFCLRSEIRGILHATVLLGLQRVKALALTVSMRVYLTDVLTIPALLACWRHSLATALIAEEVVGVSYMDKDAAYTAGLLHDIGRLALAVIHPAQYANFLSSAPRTDAEILEGERQLFEVDHCQAGRWLVEAWKLPKEFVDITSRHHVEINDKFDLFAVVRFSCALANALGFCAIPPLGLPNFEDLLQKLPDWGRGCFGFDPNEVALRIATKINSMSLW
jgi:putative nucleotidyltransferase with HDIG domain